MKLVINTKRIFLHKNDYKREKNKRRIKSFAEWRQDTKSTVQADSDDAIHEECMRLIGLPTVLDGVEVQPTLRGGRLFSEVLAIDSPPLINVARQRIRKPPEQGNNPNNVVNGENSQRNNSSDFGLEYESESAQNNDSQENHENHTPNHEAMSANKPENTSFNNTIDKDNNDEDVDDLSAEEMTALRNVLDDIDNNQTTQNKGEQNITNVITNTIKKDVISDEEIANNERTSITDNFQQLLNNNMLDENNLLDNKRNGNNETDESEEATGVDIKMQDAWTNEANLLDSDNILNSNNINKADEDTITGNKLKDAVIKKEGNCEDTEESNLVNNNLKESTSEDIAQDSPINNETRNDKINELGNFNSSIINNHDNSETLHFSDENDINKDILDNTENNIKSEKDPSDFIDLTHLGEIRPSKIPINTLIDLTFADKESVKTRFDGNTLIDLASTENFDKSALNNIHKTEVKSDMIKVSEIEDTMDILMDILNYDLDNEPILIGMNIQDGEVVDSKSNIKMQIEPQPSTSANNTSLMKSIMRRKGKRRRQDGDDVDEEDTEPRERQNKAKTKLEYISMDDLMAKDIDDDDDDDDEMSIAQTYADYKPRKLNFGCKHPDPVVETASLSSVEPADVTYQLSFPEETITKGLLSAVQLEAVVYASQAHEILLPAGTRAGFLIGDGAGVGKGRTVAGVTFDNYLKGRKRALWFSVSRDLKYDAERDLRDIGAGFITAHNIVDMKYNDDISSPTNGNVDEGVIFSTYSSLVSKNNSGCKYSSRLEQLLQWCGPDFDGVIIFDECHKAKNLHTSHTQTGQNVLELQNRLPKARVVYASATGASEPHNMAYMVRLGIWGEGTPFKDFEDFNKAVEKRGVSAMELVAMDLKQRGVYIARQLSFQGVNVHIRHVPMSAALKAVYDDSTKLWSKARIKFEEAIAQNSAMLSQTQKRTIWSQFWGNHQRFFKYLCIAAKVEAAVKEAMDAVNNGKCAVIGLQGTGEARTLDIIKNSETELTDFISTSEGVFQNLLEKQFPTEDYCLKVKRRKLSLDSTDLSTTEAMQAELLSDIKQLGPRLPKNTLDELVDKLGGPSQVAEMTGRVGRMLHKNGATVYESRAWGLIKQENVNMAEKQLFMDGKKNIAVISEAASSGISLQSDRRALNKKRRVHITLELPWSADQAVQQFGRTHRSNQVNAPEYIFLISDLAGERRFASTVAKRLESLGALTHGDRRATETRDLSQFNIDNKYGRLALSKMMSTLSGMDPEVLVPPPPEHPHFIRDVTNALRDVMFFEQKSVQKYDTATFLNRILGIPVDLQNLLFKYYTDTLAGVIELAKRNNKFDMGILELGVSTRVRHVTSHGYRMRHATGFGLVTLHHVVCERGMDWSSAEQAALSKTGHERSFYRPRAGVKNKHIIMCISVFTNVKNSLVWVYSPNSGQAKETQSIEDIKKNYSKITKLEWAQAEWDKQYRHALKACRHEQCRNKTVCQSSRAVRPYHMLSGSLLGVWTQVEDLLLAGRRNIAMRVVRANTDDGRNIIGILIPKKYVARLQEELSKDTNEKKDTKPVADNKLLVKPGTSTPLRAKENLPHIVQSQFFM